MDNLSLAIMKKWKISFCMVISYLVLELSYQGHAVQGTCMKKETRIILIGKTGAGKSATGNSILGKEAFKTDIGMLSETRTTSYHTTCRFGRKLVVVDTPGLEDTSLSTSEVLTEITKSYTMVSPGPHAFVMIIEPGRFTKEDKRVLDEYEKYFGQTFHDYLVLVFTKKKRIEKESSLEKIVEKVPENHSMKKLLKAIKKRYMAIDYSYNLEDQKEDVLKLLDIVEKIKEENNPEFFESKLSSNTEKLFSYLSKILDFIGDTSNEEDRREKIRAYIFNMYTMYAIQIAAMVAYSYFGGDGITVGNAIIEKLIEYGSFYLKRHPV
ncbi:GTPase IMAP family member 9-like [Saccostrea cucullata]|uniref:GTPase IMAP family member 9-like n=1 Tax=Saccostrea cuccullata TaxID=36930 RepID=UPI002ED0AE18